jgi:hypothetical protein
VTINVNSDCSPGVLSMSTWRSIYRVVRASHYNASNAPIQLPRSKTRRSQGHYGLSPFTKIYTPDQLQLDTCLPVKLPHLGRPPVASDLHHDLLSL